MLKFYFNKETTFTGWVSDKLKEMVVAHEVIRVDDKQALPKNVSFEELPLLTDGHENWPAEDEIKSFLNKLHNDLKLSQSLQSDACHLDPDNPDECL